MKRWQLFGGRALVSAERRAKAKEWTHRIFDEIAGRFRESNGASFTRVESRMTIA
jgi:hypothetical protein